MNTTVDVIIPLHNDELFIGLAIKSVLAQTFQFNKLFVVNDRSTDASVAIVRELEKIDSRITILENSRIERSSARNTGIKASNAEYIAFLDKLHASMLNKSSGVVRSSDYISDSSSHHNLICWWLMYRQLKKVCHYYWTLFKVQLRIFIKKYVFASRYFLIIEKPKYSLKTSGTIILPSCC